MKNCLTKLKKVASKVKGAAVAGALALSVVAATGVTNVFAAEGDPTSIAINFEATEMFKYSNVILECLMPVVE